MHASYCVLAEYAVCSFAAAAAAVYTGNGQTFRSFYPSIDREDVTVVLLLLLGMPCLCLLCLGKHFRPPPRSIGDHLMLKLRTV